MLQHCYYDGRVLRSCDAAETGNRVWNWVVCAKEVASYQLKTRSRTSSEHVSQQQNKNQECRRPPSMSIFAPLWLPQSRSQFEAQYMACFVGSLLPTKAVHLPILLPLWSKLFKAHKSWTSLFMICGWPLSIVTTTASTSSSPSKWESLQNSLSLASPPSISIPAHSSPRNFIPF